MKSFCTHIVLVSLLLFMLSCNERKYITELQYADSIMESAPDSAYQILSSLSDSVEQFDTKNRMMYYTLLGDACNKLYKPLPSDTILNEVVDYYDSHGTSNQRMKSRYLLGCYHRDNNDAPEALKHYQEAVACADTLDADCDYTTLFSIYGQMAFIYREHFLWDEEIDAWHNYSHYSSKNNDKYNEIRGIEFLIHPYYYMNDSAKVVQLADTCYKLYMANGMTCAAASVLYIPIYYQIKASNYDKASNLMSVYETQSGLFDENGNIARGYEKYYYIKGMYYIQIHELDSAEQYFRKIANHGIDYYSYKGLLDIYRIKMIQDSIGKYSDLLENSLDDLLSQKATDAVVKSESLFNYNRANKIAEQKKIESEKSKLTIWIVLAITLILLLSALVCFVVYRKNKSREMEIVRMRFVQTLTELDKLKEEHKELTLAYNELKSISSTAKDHLDNLEKILNDKQDEINMMEKAVEEYKSIYHGVIQGNILDNFKDSVLLKSIRIRLKMPSCDSALSNAEEVQIYKELKTCLPHLYHKIIFNNNLTKQELITTVLILADFTTKEISYLLNTSISRVSNIRMSINHKIFKETSARTLSYNLRKMATDIKNV